MVQIGQINRLTITEIRPEGVYLDGQEDGEVFVPSALASRDWEIGASAEVFVHYDSNRLVATTVVPLAMVGEFACLKVTSIEEVGAFLDWGLTKDLFLPFREQTHEFRVGHYVIVHVYIDSSGRICASMRTDKYIDTSRPNYYDGERVHLFIVGKTDLGYKAIINDRHYGVLYFNEVFQPLDYGDRRNGFIKKVRDDGKIDLALTQAGHRDAEDIGQQILDLLEREEGFIEIDDSTSAEVIYNTFGVSKKKFKMALGGLLKRQVIGFENGGIRLI